MLREVAEEYLILCCVVHSHNAASQVSRGTVILSIFAPFWFVNKTQRRLHFKGHDGTNELVHYPEEAEVRGSALYKFCRGL